MHKTRLTQNSKPRHTTNANQKYEEDKEEVTETLGTIFLQYPGRIFPFSEALDPMVRGKNWNRSSSKGTWGLWEDIQGEQMRMETDSGFPMQSCCCSVEWLTTYSN